MSRRLSDRINVIAVTFNMTDHCNLSCANCNHASPLLPEKYASLDGFKADVAALSQVMRAEEIKLLGGEPTLHPELIEFMEVAKASNLAERLRIISNAVLLHKMPERLWELTDVMELSIYPGVKYKGGGADGLQLFREMAAKHDVELILPGRQSFKKTMLNNKIEDPILVDAIYRNCTQVSKVGCHSVHEGRYYKCGPAPYLEERMSMRGERVENKLIDSVQVRNNPNLREELERFLTSDKPLLACFYCLGDNGVDIIHRQINKKEVRAENLANDGDVVQQVWFPPVEQAQMAVRRQLLRILG